MEEGRYSYIMRIRVGRKIRMEEGRCSYIMTNKIWKIKQG